jgi:hypothetical protein
MKTAIRVWQWPNLLALDAAAIAVAWQTVFADRLFDGPGVPSYLVLALSVWLTYQADRLFDVGNRTATQIKSTRHRFAKQHQNSLWKIWLGLLSINLLIGFTGLSAEQRLSGFHLLIICLIYTFLNQKLSQRFFPKELCVALIFTGGTQVFLRGQVDIPSIVAFALLCFMNCIIIAKKEKLIDARLRVRSLGSSINSRFLNSLIYLTLVFSLLADQWIALVPGALCLACLQVWRHRFDTELFRVLCDTSLLIGPLLYFFLFGTFVK